MNYEEIYIRKNSMKKMIEGTEWNIKTKKQFKKVDIFSRESETEDDELHKTENL